MRLFLALLSSILFIQCSNTANLSGQWQDDVVESYYQIWHTGAAPAGTGANFFILLKAPLSYSIEEFKVNGEPLEVETKENGKGLLIIGRHFTPPNPEQEDQKVPKFYLQEAYSGKLKLTQAGESFWVKVDNFQKRESEMMP
ncbi:MAG: hypothetical protein N4A46_14175 [Schleiferiaceae bacterium]|jgi:hypothetical protein|nr:hypothetical protein [Schleiferiaceae bacterium]